MICALLLREGVVPIKTGKLRMSLRLMVQMLYISAFTFGGGFVIVSFMKKVFVDRYGWMTEQEMLDITALAQSSPGAIAVNAAILVGWKMAGLIGMVFAVLGTILPPMVILTVVSMFYKAFASNLYVALVLKGMQAGVAAVILDVVFNLLGSLLKSGNRIHPYLAAAAFVLAFFFDINVILVILGAGLTGLILALIGRRKEARHDPS